MFFWFHIAAYLYHKRQWQEEILQLSPRLPRIKSKIVWCISLYIAPLILPSLVSYKNFLQHKTHRLQQNLHMDEVLDGTVVLQNMQPVPPGHLMKLMQILLESVCPVLEEILANWDDKLSDQCQSDVPLVNYTCQNAIKYAKHNYLSNTLSYHY